MVVYLIHLERKFKHAQHYIGWTDYDDPEYRMKHHRNGNGSKFLRAVNKAGIDYSIVRTWPGKDGNFERFLKNKKHASRFCPICSPQKQLL